MLRGAPKNFRHPEGGGFEKIFGLRGPPKKAEALINWDGNIRTCGLAGSRRKKHKAYN